MPGRDSPKGVLSGIRRCASVRRRHEGAIRGIDWAVHPSDGSLPEGQIFHAAGPSADGWTIIAVHDSQASWERFRDGVLMPRMTQGIEGGFTAPPQETTFPVHNQVGA